jgi:hypothetical protein
MKGSRDMETYSGESHSDFASGAEQERNRRRSERRKGKVEIKRDFRHAGTRVNILVEEAI